MAWTMQDGPNGHDGLQLSWSARRGSLLRIASVPMSIPVLGSSISCPSSSVAASIHSSRHLLARICDGPVRRDERIYKKLRGTPWLSSLTSL